MTQTGNLSYRWENFRPSKTLWFWSLAGAVVATMVVGFTVGGWTTGGTAAKMAEKASRDARTQLAASICVEKFVSAANAATQLATLKERSRWERDDFVEDGGWAKLIGLEKPVTGAADLCAEELVAMENLPARNIAPVSTDG